VDTDLIRRSKAEWAVKIDFNASCFFLTADRKMKNVVFFKIPLQDVGPVRYRFLVSAQVGRDL
jgi:stress response protein SCP2